MENLDLGINNFADIIFYIMDNKRSSFKGSIGFVLAAAGSAVGLGNLWRFPYLAAKGGGGLFLVIYIALALTFGFTLMMTEVSIGRKTKQSPLTAYSKLAEDNKVVNVIGKILGALASLVPFIILPYYCVIGGWVMKYMVAFITGSGTAAAQDGYFTGFITNPSEPLIYGAIFLVITGVIIFLGVNNGIESLSKLLMPVLLVLVIGISIFALTIKTGDRSGLDGLKIYLIPSVKGLSGGDIIGVVFDAIGQLFFSISVAMGILVAYGSYFKDEDNLVKSVNQIEFFDTLIAFLAGIMIIPAVYVFMGREGLANSGPGLMFVAIPKVFEQMGKVGSIVGIVFFVMVFLAAITSSISILEAIVSGLIDRFHMKRGIATLIECIIAGVLGWIVCGGYNGTFDVNVILPTSDKPQQILDIFDYASNNVLMPVVAILTCILVGWIIKPEAIIDEATKNGEKFGRKTLYIVMIKVVVPVLLILLLMRSSGLVKF